MSVAVVRFPGSLDHDSAARAVKAAGGTAAFAWQDDRELPAGTTAVLLPGGFSYGDHLRPGAIASRAPIMDAVRRHAQAGGRVLGICNGFQVLCESGLLPGVLMRNDSLEFRCEWTYLRREGGASPWVDGIVPGSVLHMPISHGEGNYYADEATVSQLEAGGRVVFRYCDAAGEVTDIANPNGSVNNIAGIINARGNVLGMMPHPERAPEQLLGGDDGNRIWESIIRQGLAVFA